MTKKFTRGFWLLPLAFFLFTGSQTPGWADASLIAGKVQSLDLQIWVNNHNLFTLVAALWVKVLPSSIELAHALNILCAVFGAATVYVVFLTGLELTESLFASVFGALALMLSHSLWWHSTMLEVYTLSTFLLTLVVWLVLRYERGHGFGYLLSASAVFGLACSNHVQMGLVGAGFVAFLLIGEHRERLLQPKPFLLMGIAFLAGFQVYLWVFAAEFLERTGSLTPERSATEVFVALLNETTGAGFRDYMFPSGLTLGERAFWWSFFAGLFVYNFPSAALVAAPAGVLRWFRSGRDRLTLTFVSLTFLVQLVWSSNYFVWDMYAFALPVYVLFAIPIALGVDWIRGKSPGLGVAFTATLFVPLLLYPRTPGLITSNESAVRMLRTLPQYDQAISFWDPLPYFFDPNKRGFDDVERYATAALDRLDQDTCYWGDEAKLLYPLKYYYQDALKRREDVRYHLIFAILEGEQEFVHYGQAVARQLVAGCPVVISSLGYPERNVLNHAFAALDPTTPLREIRRLSTAAFVESFPRFQLTPIALDPSGTPHLYEANRRESSDSQAF